MNDSTGHPDLIVIGGGVIGLAAGREAARRGLRVVLLERGDPAMKATWAAAGMLSPLGESHGPGPYLEFGIESLRMYADWLGALEDESGTPVEYRECGKLRSARSETELRDLELRREWADAAGLTTRWLAEDDLVRTVPALAPEVRAGLLVAEDFRVDNRALGRALVGAADGAGVEIRPGTAVRSIRSEGGRVEGVTLEDGSRVDAPRVLLAAGAWSGSIGGLPRPLPVQPVRGQMLSVSAVRPPTPHVLEAADVYLVPRDDGRILIGATQEDAGFREDNTVRGIRDLLEAAVRLVPALADARVEEFWAGLRPGTSDGQPILGPHPGLDGLLVATGHFRNGILLAPATARLLGALLEGEDPTGMPRGFVPDRLATLEAPAGNT